MALDHSFQGKVTPFYDSEALNRQQSVSGAGRSKTTTGTKQERKRILVEANQYDDSSFKKLGDRSPFHNMKSRLSSSSASPYPSKEHPFLIIKMIS